jgi:type II secretory pathway predicted ATPase ExeA/osmotically-inducible protein OsmY
MNYENLAADRSSPFTGPFDADALYMSPPYREALATLRYGIEAGKGFILCVGEPGTGKSALLQKLAREPRPGVTLLLISDPHLSLSEILRRLLRRLGVEPTSENDAALIRQCRAHLRAHTDIGRVVAVAFDDAHHLRDRIVEQILGNFIAHGTADTQPHLAQIVFAGRPELKERFQREPLRDAAPVALECTLPVLTANETRDYIQFRLCGAGLADNLFDAAALQSIAHFSEGRLHLINTLCDRAFQGTDPSARKQFGADRIESAAKDLDLWRPSWVRKDEQETQSPEPPGNDEIFRFESLGEDATQSVGETFLHLSGAGAGRRWFRAGRRRRRFPRVLTAAALIAVPGVWLYGDLVKNSVSEWSAALGDIASIKRQLLPQTDTPPPLLPAESQTARAATPMPPETTLPPTPDVENIGGMPPAAIEETAPTPAPVDPITEVKPQTPRQTGAPSQPPPQELSGRTGNDPVQQISKAIENRAITGVRVTIKDDIAFLDGRVASERQRRAAEKAAREAGQVRGVRNRIVIERSPPITAPTSRFGTDEVRAPRPASREFSDEVQINPVTQISKAIENRAIAGVRVTIKDDIVFLDGRVATERQRRAAEEAARETGEVRGVRNRIVIE